ncbi:hypothetical protein NECAME_00114 [Necator americanus]|uniref:Endonuclease/exonuclease/phosphatase domain-containing protein n=1 Tax=Necator americanus TaxID=51031 RepID=W2TYY0_NECAM|nr:hypothetical protein NECAME_00114 [Necator americanus]ETN87255.1 hypothetical protein NECAME_00114 [Necator americanus]
MGQSGPTLALTIIVAYGRTSSHGQDEVETSYMDIEKFYRVDHAFYRLIVGNFNTKIGPEEGLGNFTSGLTAYNGTNKRRGFRSLSWRPSPHMGSRNFRSLPLYARHRTLRGRYHSEIDQIVVTKRFHRCCAKALYGIQASPSLRKIFFHTECRESR